MTQVTLTAVWQHWRRGAVLVACFFTAFVLAILFLVPLAFIQALVLHFFFTVADERSYMEQWAGPLGGAVLGLGLLPIAFSIVVTRARKLIGLPAVPQLPRSEG